MSNRPVNVTTSKAIAANLGHGRVSLQAMMIAAPPNGAKIASTPPTTFGWIRSTAIAGRNPCSAMPIDSIAGILLGVAVQFILTKK